VLFRSRLKVKDPSFGPKYDAIKVKVDAARNK
jgi:hypothetical protein